MARTDDNRRYDLDEGSRGSIPDSDQTMELQVDAGPVRMVRIRVAEDGHVYIDVRVRSEGRGGLALVGAHIGSGDARLVLAATPKGRPRGA